MIRRLLRFTLAAFCLLSLLAALGVSWLWWENRHERHWWNSTSCSAAAHSRARQFLACGGGIRWFSPWRSGGLDRNVPFTPPASGGNQSQGRASDVVE